MHDSGPFCIDVPCFIVSHVVEKPGVGWVHFATAAGLIALQSSRRKASLHTDRCVSRFRPLPVRDPHNLVQLFEQQSKRLVDRLLDYRFYK